MADKAALGFLDAAALPILLAISNALTGLLATFYPKLTVALPTLLKKSFNPSASIFASLTVINLFLLHLKQLPFSVLVPFEVIREADSPIKPLMLLVPLKCQPPTQYELILNTCKRLISIYKK